MASLYPQKWSLGIRLASHMLRRCSYHYDKKRIRSFAKKKPPEALEELLSEALQPLADRPPTLSLDAINTWWLHQAQVAPTLNAKMTFFLHTVFVCDFMSTSLKLKTISLSNKESVFLT